MTCRCKNGHKGTGSCHCRGKNSSYSGEMRNKLANPDENTVNLHLEIRDYRDLFVRSTSPLQIMMN